MPVDSTPPRVPASAQPAAAAYAGRRVAVLERAVASDPVGLVARASGFSDDTMERVLGALEPVDQTTCFAHEVTERIPRIDVTATSEEPVVLPVLATAGKRRAARPAARRPPALRSLPSVPVLLGLAALAVSVGATLISHDPAPSDQTTTSLRPVSALTGSTAIVRARARDAVVTRSANRQAQSTASAAANSLAQQRTTKLGKIDQKTAAYNKVLESNQWITPITPGGYHLTARFGQYGLWANFHTGLDFAAPTGTPIHAIASGTVTFAQYDGSYGNKTVVLLADGTEIWYAHQNEFGVSVGDTVTQGETIGYVGSTGNTTGPHVHIEVRPDGGDPIDPFPAFEQHGITP